MEEFIMSSVNTNMSSIIAQNNLANTQSAMQTSLQRLSSGYRINSSADDAAGLAISQKMISQIGGLNQANSNAQSAVSMMQTADGAMAQTQSILQQMRTLAVQAASDTNTASDRLAIQSQVNGLAQQISNISNTTTFNTQNLLAGGLTSKFQIGSMQGQTTNISIGAMDAQTLGVAGKENIKASNTSGSNINVGGVMNLGDGLTAQTYQLKTTVTYANSGGSAINATSTGLSGTTGVYTGAFTGQVNTTYEIRVDALGLSGLSGGGTGMIAVSSDGGQTWGSDQVYSGAGTGMLLGNNVSWTQGGNTNAQVGDIYTAYFTPWSASLQLLNSSGTSVGSAVTVNNQTTTTTVGNVKTLEQMDVNFTAAGSLGVSGVSGIAAGTATLFQSVGQLFSTAATTSNGVVTVNANVVNGNGINVSSDVSAGNAITAIDKAIATVSAARAQLGASMANMTSTMANLQSTSTNLTAANSAIVDTDMAAEMSNFTRLQILSQAGTSMLSQANQSSQSILKLLQ